MLRFPARDGVQLDGAIVGVGPVGAVLLHEYPGPVADVAGAIAVLRSHGAHSVALVGASLGGVVAVIAGAGLRPAAVVDLSGERDLTGLLPGTSLDAFAAAPALRMPALFVVARGDRNVSVGDMRAVFDRAGSRVKRVIVLPASQGHGWDMLESLAGFSPLAGTSSCLHQGTHRAMTRRGACVCAVALLAGSCGSAAPHARSIASLDGCVPLSGAVRNVVIHRASGTPLSAGLIGGGSTTFVLTDESDENLCSWLAVVATLRTHGYSALLYDYSDATELPREVTAAARSALSAGARHVVLMGASVGARASIEAAVARPRGVIAVVSLSAEQSVRSDPTDLAAVARRVTLPTLLISSSADPFVAGFTPQLRRSLGASDKHALILPGLDHGTALLTGKYGLHVDAAILKFVADLPHT